MAAAAVGVGALAWRLIGQMKVASSVALAASEAGARAVPEGRSLTAKRRSKPRNLEVPEFAFLTETNVRTG